LNFIHGKEALTALEWVLRGSVSFVFLLIIAKFMGQRSISQLRLLDFIIALTLGNIIAHPLSDQKIGLQGSFITTATFTALYVTGTWLSLKWPRFNRFLHPTPITLIQNGQIQFHHLAKARISADFLFSELRKEKVEDIQKVSLALWEPGGIISVFMDTPYQPVTRADMDLKTQPFSITRPIIVDGQIEMTLLQEMGKDLGWLEEQIAGASVDIPDVMLATVSNNAVVQVKKRRQR